MNIRLDPAHLSVGADAFEDRAAHLTDRRAQIEASVDALLAAWQGAAADRFARSWEEWRDCADDVIAGLAGRAEALRRASTNWSPS
jgi:WXG100 family type VII secretion target